MSDFLQVIFRKCIAAIIGANGVHIDQGAFEYVVLLAELRMQELYSHLAKLSSIQRRTQPSLSDLGLLFAMHNLDPFQLERQMSLSGPHVDALNSFQLNPTEADIDEASQAFFDSKIFEINRIVESKQRLPSYAPEWSPALPPDHTYLASADFRNRVRGLQELHEDLVEEGHLAERALQQLLGSNGSESAIDLSKPREKPRLHTVHIANANGTASDLQKNGGTRPLAATTPEATVSASRTAEKAPAATLPENEMTPENEAEDVDMAVAEDTNGVPVQRPRLAAKGPVVDNSEPPQGANETAEANGSTSADAEDEQPRQSYITIVNSAPEPKPKPLSLKISLKPPKKKHKLSKRPKIDIERLAKEPRKKDEQGEAPNTEMLSLDALLAVSLREVQSHDI